MSASILISVSSPPITSAIATPSVCSIRFLIMCSEMSRTVFWSLPEIERIMIGLAAGSTLKMLGRPAVSGSVAASSFSLRYRTAKSMSVPQLKSIVIREMDSFDSDLMLMMSLSPAIEASSGSVTSLSTCSGELPSSSVHTVSEGYLMSGRRLTGSLLYDMMPKSVIAVNTIITVIGLERIVLSILFVRDYYIGIVS